MSITNHRAVDMQVIYLETLPWHIQFYLHTMKITVNGERRGKDSISRSFRQIMILIISLRR